MTALPLDMPREDETAHWQAVLVAISQIGAIGYRQPRGLAVPVGASRPVQFGVDGGGDVVACFRGWAIQIETKLPRGKHLVSQQRFQAAWERAGGIYILARARSAREAAALVVERLLSLPERPVAC